MFNHHINIPIDKNTKSKDREGRSVSGRTGSTAFATEKAKENKGDDSSDSDDGDDNKRQQRNLDEDAKQLDTVFEIDEDNFNLDEEQKIDTTKVKNKLDSPQPKGTEILKKKSSKDDPTISKKSSSKHKSDKKDKKDKKSKKDKKDKKEKKSKDDKEPQKDEEQDEEEKIEMPEKQETQIDAGSSQSLKSSLSVKSTRVFKPSTQKNKSKKIEVEVDEKGLLRISGFDPSLNIKLTNQLPELFKKISTRFKVSSKMDIFTYIKTLHNMYQQHYNKCLKQTGEFNDSNSAIIFPQIVRFMIDKKFLQGELLELIVEKDLSDPKKIEEIPKVIIDWDGLLNIFKEYDLKTERDGTTVEDKKINLSLEDKVELTTTISKLVLINLTKSYEGLPKNKSAMLKKIGSIIRMHASSNAINADFKQTLDRNKQVRFWVLDLLQEINIIIWGRTDSKEFKINTDKIPEYVDYIEKDEENFREEVKKMDFL